MTVIKFTSEAKGQKASKSKKYNFPIFLYSYKKVICSTKLTRQLKKLCILVKFINKLNIKI